MVCDPATGWVLAIAWVGYPPSGKALASGGVSYQGPANDLPKGGLSIFKKCVLCGFLIIRKLFFANLMFTMFTFANRFQK